MSPLLVKLLQLQRHSSLALLHVAAELPLALIMRVGEVNTVDKGPYTRITMTSHHLTLDCRISRSFMLYSMASKCRMVGV